MTREEAIKELSYIADEMPSMECADWIKAISMAIEALEQEPCISEDGTLTVNVKDGSKVTRVLVCGDNHFGGLYYPEQEPCDVYISRQAAIDALERFIHELGIKDEPYNYGEMALSPQNVPPVTPADDKCQECKKDWTKCGRCPVTMEWVKEQKARCRDEQS